MRPRDPRPLSEIPHHELPPKVLSSPGGYLFFACLYSAIHLGLIYYIYFVEPPPFSPEYNRAVAVIIIGPFFYSVHTHLQFIWWPCYREMKRRGGLPPKQLRKPPYVLGPIGSVAMSFGGTVLTMGAAPCVLIWFEHFSEGRRYGLGVMLTVVGPLIWLLGMYCGHFFYEEKKHEQS
ncbi:MAG: hypothetical protein O9254_00905 [Rhodobacteraceae bacterium]|nr:hypothetical protein [Paracoccaceae bacterium]